MGQVAHPYYTEINTRLEIQYLNTKGMSNVSESRDIYYQNLGTLRHEIRLNYTCDMTHLTWQALQQDNAYVCHDSFICAPWLIYMYDKTHITHCVMGVLARLDLARLDMRYCSHIAWCVSLTCVITLNYICDKFVNHIYLIRSISYMIRHTSGLL